MFLSELIILILCFLFLYTNNSPILKISLETVNGDNFICTRICFGSFPQCFNLQIDFQSFYVMIYNKSTELPPFTKSFDIFNSTTFSLNNKNTVNITYPIYVTEAYGANDQISIDNTFNFKKYLSQVEDSHNEVVFSVFNLKEYHSKLNKYVEKIVIMNYIKKSIKE